MINYSNKRQFVECLLKVVKEDLEKADAEAYTAEDMKDIAKALEFLGDEYNLAVPDSVKKVAEGSVEEGKILDQLKAFAKQVMMQVALISTFVSPTHAINPPTDYSVAMSLDFKDALANNEDMLQGIYSGAYTTRFKDDKDGKCSMQWEMNYDSEDAMFLPTKTADNCQERISGGSWETVETFLATNSCEPGECLLALSVYPSGELDVVISMNKDTPNMAPGIIDRDFYSLEGANYKEAYAFICDKLPKMKENITEDEFKIQIQKTAEKLLEQELAGETESELH